MQFILLRSASRSSSYSQTLGCVWFVGANSGNVLINPSRVEVVACAILKVLISTDQAKHGNFLRDSVLSTSANLRGRTGIKGGLESKNIPDKVSGNFYFQTPIKFVWGNTGTKMEDLELHHLVSLYTTLKGELMECSKMSKPNEVVTEVAKKIDLVSEEIKNERVNVLFLKSSCKFPMYDVDFGWGKPVWVAAPCAPANMVVLMDSKCGTKIEATVNLSEPDMHVFENHPDTLAFTSLAPAHWVVIINESFISYGYSYTHRTTVSGGGNVYETEQLFQVGGMFP